MKTVSVGSESLTDLHGHEVFVATPSSSLVQRATITKAFHQGAPEYLSLQIRISGQGHGSLDDVDGIAWVENPSDSAILLSNIATRREDGSLLFNTSTERCHALVRA